MSYHKRDRSDEWYRENQEYLEKRRNEDKKVLLIQAIGASVFPIIVALKMLARGESTRLALMWLAGGIVTGIFYYNVIKTPRREDRVEQSFRQSLGGYNFERDPSLMQDRDSEFNRLDEFEEKYSDYKDNNEIS